MLTYQRQWIYIKNDNRMQVIWEVGRWLIAILSKVVNELCVAPMWLARENATNCSARG